MFLHHKHASIDSIETKISVTTRKGRRHFYKNKRLLVILIPVCLSVVAAGFVIYRHTQQSATFNPFNAAILASAQTPLYYPTNLPSGYHIVKNSITEPQAGVVVFNIDGPSNQKIYMSEEARPSTFNMGNLYTKLSGLKEIAVSGGSIATGNLNNSQTEVGSRIYNKTWVLTNTNASIPMSSLTTMLKSLTLSY